MTEMSYNRADFRRRPLKAWRHFQNLMANKEDTAQVFHIIQALNGRAFFKNYKNFVASEDGRARQAENRYLPKYLDQREKWLALPKNTLGYAYASFMEREGLTAQGLVDEYDGFANAYTENLSPELRWFGDRMRDTHDMCHILTDYGRDALGELCVLAYSYAQHGGLGVIFISVMGGFNVKKHAPKGTPVFRAIWQAYRTGRRVKDIAYSDIIALMDTDLATLKADKGLGAPTYYEACHRVMRKNGIDPYSVIGAPESDADLVTA